MRCKVLGPKGDSIEAFIACCGDRNMSEILTKTHFPMSNMSINEELLAILVLFDRLKSQNKNRTHIFKIEAH